ncbi:hypothetical protein [Methylocystis hirsuta]|uniref:Uncharacterized protein n=1 Tax=Methylocystis hirsuta TaxID=369798 RepID=A0A3M9XUA3_9HYPH|nr:hypothetical protein [Methylocystis hirsuta]RNJ50450.1 hypothetical protein D1O30_13530 [Methylocystis hirsuta]
MPPKTKDWYAWLNLMPPPPDDFHVIGKVLVPNPGVLAQLCFKEPQGINPAILLLDLHLVQQPGMWPQVMTWATARYDEILPPGRAKYSEVEVFFENASIARIKVDIVS